MRYILSKIGINMRFHVTCMNVHEISREMLKPECEAQSEGLGEHGCIGEKCLIVFITYIQQDVHINLQIK